MGKSTLIGTEKWNIMILGKGLILYSLLMAAIPVFIIQKYQSPGMRLGIFVMAVILLVYFWTKFFSGNKLNRSDFLIFAKIPAKKYFIVFTFLLCSYLGILLLGELIDLFFGAAKSQTNDELVKMLMDSSFTKLELFFYIGIFGPVIEEILFRGLLFKSLERKVGTLGGLLISAVGFTFLHQAGDYPQILLVGLMLGLVYIVTRNIIFPILLHIINNTLAVLMETSQIAGDERTYPLMWIIGAVGLLFAIYTGIKLLRKIEFKKAGKLTKKESIWGIVYFLLTAAAIPIMISKPPYESAVSLIITVFTCILILIFIVWNKIARILLSTILLLLTLAVFSPLNKDSDLYLEEIPLSSGMTSFPHFNNNFIITTKRSEPLRVYKLNENNELEKVFEKKGCGEHPFGKISPDGEQITIWMRDHRDIYFLKTGKLIERIDYGKSKKKDKRYIEFDNVRYKPEDTQISCYTGGETHILTLTQSQRTTYYKKAGFVVSTYKDKKQLYDERIKIVYYNQRAEKILEVEQEYSFEYRNKDGKLEVIRFTAQGQKIIYYDYHGKIINEHDTGIELSDYKFSHFCDSVIMGENKKEVILIVNDSIRRHKKAIIFGSFHAFLQNDKYLVLSHRSIFYTKFTVEDLATGKMYTKWVFPAMYSYSTGRLNDKDFLLVFTVDQSRLKGKTVLIRFAIRDDS